MSLPEAVAIADLLAGSEPATVAIDSVEQAPESPHLLCRAEGWLSVASETLDLR